jgi:hypothetical protein
LLVEVFVNWYHALQGQQWPLGWMEFSWRYDDLLKMINLLLERLRIIYKPYNFRTKMKTLSNFVVVPSLFVETPKVHHQEELKWIGLVSTIPLMSSFSIWISYFMNLLLCFWVCDVTISWPAQRLLVVVAVFVSLIIFIYRLLKASLWCLGSWWSSECPGGWSNSVGESYVGLVCEMS